MSAALSAETIQEASHRLVEAEESRKAIPPLVQTYPGLSADDAYRIQMATIDRKLEAGARVVGHKIGLTSVAMQQLLGVDQPDFGHILDTMMVPNGGALQRSDLVYPRVEGEIAFVLAEDLRGPGVTVPRVLAATKYVMPALEVVDSRVADWKITLADTIADNASSCRMVVGGRCLPVDGLDLRLVGMILEKNGEIVNSAAGAAVLGNPAQAVAWLANRLADFDVTLRAGEVILPGALTAAVSVEAGDTVQATFDHLGSVCVRFV
ncbi:MAG TPA: fumarylacetoacetate hydrolase family protein [Chloroflexota bacterium]|nr:fumarylacetoacetate hydrolase family protein [Chloroflexota bacterium]